MQTVELICISHPIFKDRKYYRHPTFPWSSESLRHINSRFLTSTNYIQYPGNWASEREAQFPSGIEMRFLLQMTSKDTLPFTWNYHGFQMLLLW